MAHRGGHRFLHRDSTSMGFKEQTLRIEPRAMPLTVNNAQP